MAGSAKPVSVTLAGELDGFPVTVAAELLLDQLPAVVRRLRAAGVQPPRATSAAGAPSAVDSPPRCPLHGSPMKPSRKGGWYCPRQDDAGAYCEHSRAASAA